MVLYAVSVFVPIETFILRIAFRTLLLLIFAGIAWQIEKPGLAKVS
jgi:uncharacterized protein YqhQ